MGTSEDPLFTYEEAVHHHHCQRGLTLYVGEDIIPVEGDRLSEMSEQNLKKLRKQVDELELPLLPEDLLPGGCHGLSWTVQQSECPRFPVFVVVKGLRLRCCSAFPRNLSTSPM